MREDGIIGTQIHMFGSDAIQSRSISVKRAACVLEDKELHGNDTQIPA